MLLFLVSVRTLGKAKISIRDSCKNMMPGKPYTDETLLLNTEETV
jgi:hypothetical protein